MAERTHIPTSPACGQWETLLADALDGLLRPEDEATFSSHMASCANCTTLFEEARQGREWLEFLSPEPEVPAGLLDKLLAQTGPGQVAGFGLATPAGNVVPITVIAQRQSLMARLRRFAEPRLLMTTAMAFFSIAVTLNLTGVRLSRVRLSDLKPSSLRMYAVRQLHHCLDAHHPLLRSPALRVRSAVQDARAAAHHPEQLNSRPEPKEAGGPRRVATDSKP